MDNKYWKDWDTRSPRKEDSTNNPYYNQPTHSPYKGQSFAIASMIFGMLSFVLNCVVGLHLCRLQLYICRFSSSQGQAPQPFCFLWDFKRLLRYWFRHIYIVTDMVTATDYAAGYLIAASIVGHSIIYKTNRNED